MPVPLLPDTIAAIADRTAAGESSAAIAAALRMSRSAISGVIYRLRQRGDRRVPPAGAPVVRTRLTEQDAIADAFADGARDLADAAGRAGLPLSLAHRRWAEIRAKYGWQAA